jgi:hypothetical protein
VTCAAGVAVVAGATEADGGGDVDGVVSITTVRVVGVLGAEGGVSGAAEPPKAGASTERDTAEARRGVERRKLILVEKANKTLNL